MIPTYMTAHDIAIAFDTGNERKTWSCRKYQSNDIEQVIFKVGSELIELVYNCNTMKTEVTFRKFIASWGDYCKAITRSYFYVLHCLRRGGVPLSMPRKHDECTILIKIEGEARIRTFVEYNEAFRGHQGTLAATSEDTENFSILSLFNIDTPDQAVTVAPDTTQDDPDADAKQEN